MAFITNAIIESYITADEIKVIVKEGLNEKNKWELLLVIPKSLHELWDAQDFVYSVRPASLLPLHSDKDGEIFFAEDPRTGRVRYFFYNGPSHGFGGYTFNLHMEDGTVRSLKGPWSSNSRAVNAVGHKPSKEVTIQGKYNMADAMTLDAINILLAPLDMECILIDNDPRIIRL